ncbi:BON domain-containing protein [bacterium]|nr:BON domain-containing protein [bacterium]
MLTDAEIHDSVAAALTRDPRVRAQSEGGAVKIRCQGGTVLLEGLVESLGEKMTCERLIQEVRGVQEVINHLKLRPIPVRTDDQILAHVRNGLEEDPYIDEKKLSIHVENGVVTLTGSQDALAKKRLAGLIAWWVAGVADVRNQIAVEPHEDDSDDEITNAVRVAFDKDKLIDSLRFQVTTRGGVVYLSGVARSSAERQAAVDDVWAVWGVRDVHTEVAIEA